MRYWRSMLLGCLSVFAAICILAWMPSLFSAGQSEVAVFGSLQDEHLTQSNLVDVLVRIPLNERISKVDWSHAVLSVELRVSPATGRPQNWFKDVERLIHTSFVQLDNVNRVLIRIAETPEEGGRLMVALDVRRTDSWLQQDLKSLEGANPVHQELWKERLRLSYTSVWEEHYGKVSGFTTSISNNGKVTD